MVRRILAASAVMVLAACGSKVPSIDKVKEDFNSPSGSTKDKNQLIQVNERRDAASPATRIAGSGGLIGGGLTAEGKLQGLDRLNMDRMFAPAVRMAHNWVGQKKLALSESAAGESCGVPSTVYLEAVTGGSASFSVDLGACSNGDVTGTMDGSIDVEASETSFSITIEMNMKNVCESTGEKWCVDGTFLYEMAGEGSGNQLGSLTFTTGWFAEGQNGAGQKFTAKGGVRTNATNGGALGGSASVEFLYYVTDGKDEYAFVMSITANGDGSGMLTIKGSDGMVSCNVKADGSGSCTGDGGAIEWTVEEAEAIETDISEGELELE